MKGKNNRNAHNKGKRKSTGIDDSTEMASPSPTKACKMEIFQMVADDLLLSVKEPEAGMALKPSDATASSLVAKLRTSDELPSGKKGNKKHGKDSKRNKDGRAIVTESPWEVERSVGGQRESNPDDTPVSESGVSGNVECPCGCSVTTRSRNLFSLRELSAAPPPSHRQPKLCQWDFNNIGFPDAAKTDTLSLTRPRDQYLPQNIHLDKEEYIIDLSLHRIERDRAQGKSSDLVFSNPCMDTKAVERRGRNWHDYKAWMAKCGLASAADSQRHPASDILWSEDVTPLIPQNQCWEKGGWVVGNLRWNYIYQNIKASI